TVKTALPAAPTMPAVPPMAPAPARAGEGKRPAPHVVATAEPRPTAADPGRLLDPLRVRHGCSRRKRAVSDRSGSACGKKSSGTSASEAERQQKSSHGFSPSGNQVPAETTRGPQGWFQAFTANPDGFALRLLVA